jgi:DNA-binding NtrC family response regulator
MSNSYMLPRILVIDDLFGRTHPNTRNEERANLCGQYLLEDVTGDEVNKGGTQKIKHPIAQVVFYRGQRPICSTIGDVVENDLEGVLQFIRSGWIEQQYRSRWTMVLLDLCFYTGRVTEESNRKICGMPEGRDEDSNPQRYFGLRILQAIQEQFTELPVIILSSKPRKEVSRDFSYLGALGFLPRGDANSPDLLKEYVQRYGLIPDNRGEIVGNSKSLLLALRAARNVARGRQNILIRGERGTGKDLLARYIHNWGGIQDSPFVAINSSILSPELFASELFGIEQGVATNVTGRRGLILNADGGDIFLDEIKDMLPQVQAGILRVIEEKKVSPVGSKRQHHVDVRFLSATNVDIEAMSAGGNFRSDFLDRLREGGTIYIPPLRERKDDIPILVERFVRDAEGMYVGALKREVDPQTLDKLYSYDWPGNIRELRSCIFNAVKSHPDVEYFVPIHIQIPKIGVTSVSSKYVDFSTPSARRILEPEEQELEELINAIAAFRINPSQPANLVGKLSRLQKAYARLLAEYLKAALGATSRPIPEKPEGKILIHPAVKLMTGNSDVSASKAADIIKRLLSVDPEVTESLLSDPILKEAYETALRLRPKQQKTKMKEEER